MSGQAGGAVAVFKDVMVPMRDEVRLAADGYLPAEGAAAAPGRYPTILARTSYDKTGRRLPRV